MDFAIMTAIFTVYSNNFKAMHWFACGKNFDRIHKLCESYYDKTSDDLDVLAEMGFRLDQTPALISDAISILQSHDKKFVVMKQSNVDYKLFCEMTTVMLNDICWSIEEMLKSLEENKERNIGIKATLEGMYDKYDLELRYLNKRRSIGVLDQV